MKTIKSIAYTMLMHPKLFALLISAIFFTILYMVLDDKHFSGVNFIKETIKKEVIKKKVNRELDQDASITAENFTQENGYGNTYQQQIDSNKTDAAIEKVTKTATDELKDDELSPGKIDIPMSQMLFDRFYFSMNTSCLLGYGDIYPVTNTAKLITMLQSLFTVSLILF
jgi:hypothetical protein